MQIRFTKKSKLSGSYMGGGFSGSGSTIDPSTLKFVPYNPDNETVWDIPDKPVNVLGLTSTGDIVAKKTGSVVFASSDASGGSQYLHQLLDVEIPTPKSGDVLMFDGSKQKWVNVSEVIFDAGNYAII